MSSNHEADDFYRYIESLQGQLHTPGWEDFHDISRMKKWFTENSIKFDQDLGLQYGNVGSPSAHIYHPIPTLQEHLGEVPGPDC